jgi:hypothetical protein
MTLLASTLKIEAEYSSETPASVYKTAWCHNPDDRQLKYYTLHRILGGKLRPARRADNFAPSISRWSK